MVNSMDLIIRRAAQHEFAAASAIISEYYEAAHVIARDIEEIFRAHYFAADGGIFLAWQGTEIVGCIGVRKIDLPGAAEIKRLYVRPEWRGQGFAQKLLAAAESFSVERGYRCIYLDTAADMHAAARLYQRNGYQPCERYNDNPQAAIFMKKELSLARDSQTRDDGL